MSRNKPSVYLLLVQTLHALVLSAMMLFPHAVRAQTATITNDVFWYAADGSPINSQGGGIFKFADPKTGKPKYYWYGVHYREADTYRANPAVTLNTVTFQAVTCYSSTDLVHWTFEGNVLTPDELKKHSDRPTWVGRLGVAYIPEKKQYALLVQHGNQVLIALADSPTGNFTWHQRISMKDRIGTPNTGDQTVFTDEDTGKSYLVYSYGQGRNKIYVSEIGVTNGMVDLLDCTQVYQGASREGNCMFKYKGRYYMFASNIYGWDASLAYYLVADDIRGPYTPTNEMAVLPGSEADYAHVTQTGFFFTVKGSQQETVVYCGDRWANFAGNGLGYNHWVPLSFEGTTPYFNSLSSWSLDARTGKWQVAPGNNFVKNGSFEADRKLIPSTVKPVQQQLTGWTSLVLQGNAISLDSNASPVLNYNNTEADRSQVTGEKSLAITDRVAFKRRVWQTIAPTPFVPLTKGRYQLTFKVKNSDGFAQLDCYVRSSNRVFKQNIATPHTDWTTITIDAIDFREGNFEIGFEAEGQRGAYCYVDDVLLVRVK